MKRVKDEKHNETIKIRSYLPTVISKFSWSSNLRGLIPESKNIPSNERTIVV